MARRTSAQGKDLSLTTKYKLKLNGPPGTFIDVYDDETGKIHQRKKYGQDGIISIDLDFNHQGKEDKHAHDYNNGNRGKRRNPTKKEHVEMKKAQKKRRSCKWKTKK